MASKWKQSVLLRGRIKASLTRHFNSISTMQPGDQIAAKTRLQALEETWESFIKSTDEAYEFCEDPEFKNPDEDFAGYEEKYIQARCLLLGLLAPGEVPDQVSHSTSPNTVENIIATQSDILQRLSLRAETMGDANLPKINIKEFSGQYKDWPSFSNSFESAIGSKQTISAVNKFHYLKSLLKGEAANVIAHLHVSNDAYQTAWERLVERYNRPKHMVAEFLNMFFNLPSISEESTSRLRKVSDGATEVVRGLEAIGHNERDCWLIHILQAKLDSVTRRKWLEESLNVESPTFEQFLKFLQRRCEELELTNQEKSMTKLPSKIPTKPVKTERLARALIGTEVTESCPGCGKFSHSLSKCNTFIELPVRQRRELVRDKQLCFNCLRASHLAHKCSTSSRCRECGSLHHTLLHSSGLQGKVINNKGNSNRTNQATFKGGNSHLVQATNEDDSGPSTSTAAALRKNESKAMVTRPARSSMEAPRAVLPTAVVKVFLSNGQAVKCRILLDSGSELSYISEGCAQRLRLKRKPSNLLVSGIGAVKTEATRGCCSLSLHSCYSNETIGISAHILPKITSSVPGSTIDSSEWRMLGELELADPSFFMSGPIDNLIGNGYIWDILMSDRITNKEGKTLAISSKLGWIITGLDAGVRQTTSLVSVVDIDQTLRRFWELEEIAARFEPDPQDILVEDHFVRTHSRDAKGKYIVQLPFKDEDPIFDNTLHGATQRFHAVERRLGRDSVLKEKYIEFMQQYQSLGHMAEVPEEELHSGNDRSFYLPHHPVLGRKLRVVFDGSYQDSEGRSLNDALHVGPKMQRDIYGVCFRFRLYEYVFSADIVKMFRQIWVAPEHCKYQRIVWREDPSAPLKHFELRTVTYGTSCAPFLAMRVLEQLAIDYEDKYPSAARIIKEEFYVDDVLKGASSVEELQHMQRELMQLLAQGGFSLDKWVTNNQQLWNTLVESPNEGGSIPLLDNDTKVLGLFWNPITDTLSYNLNREISHIITKRQILSDMSSVFDPLGLLAPVIVNFKILFQELWLHNLNWDDPIPEALAKHWINMREDLAQVNNISIPRFALNGDGPLQLHGFSDASIKAYAAAVYCRQLDKDGNVHTALLTAKTRVAPLKQTSLPRLELCGALLLSRLIANIRVHFHDRALQTYAYCDSNVVLAWLSVPPIRLKTFVGNRTSEILETLPRNSWRHVKSKDNPADCASRGMLSSNLIKFGLWWNGPPWLRDRDLNYEPIHNSVLIPDSIPELKSSATTLHTISEEDNCIEALIHRVSKWRMAYRALAWAQRFANKLLHQSATKGPLTFAEIQHAKVTIIKHAQRQFSAEIEVLLRNDTLKKDSKLWTLSPFIDETGVLRVGGRLQHAEISNDAKHPVILPKRHRVSDLLISDFHERHQHPGVSALSVIIRQEYWILGARNMIRALTHKCIKCFRQRSQTSTQQMADLPTIRARQAFPFEHTGCDYAGPITLKISRGRKAREAKGYICIFVCMVTSALHIELVSDLSTDAFLAAFRQFAARRGKPRHMYSDNGRNFLGAKRVLNEMYQTLQSECFNEVISAALAHEGIEWQFIPPYAPHWGGKWEAAVRCVKLHLRRVLGQTILTIEQMRTLLTQIEGTVNSRPLCATSDTDIEYLSPAHFLIGRTLTAIPEGNLLHLPENRLGYWQHIQQMVQGFWKRWHQDYLTTLQQRPKWQKAVANLQEGTLVVVKDENLPPSHWMLGRITAVLPGHDGLVRAVKLRTSHGETTRAITKVAPLPDC